MNDPGVTINTDSTNRLNTVSTPLSTVSSPLTTVNSPVNTVSSSFTTVDPGRAKEQRNEYEILFDPLILDLEDIVDLQDTGIFGSAYDDEYVDVEADLNNLETNMSVSPIPIKIILKHKSLERWNQVTHALDDESWVEATQEELLQFKLLNVYTLVDLPHEQKLVAQGYRQEEGVDYDEVFAPVARIEAMRLSIVKDWHIPQSDKYVIYLKEDLAYLNCEDTKLLLYMRHTTLNITKITSRPIKTVGPKSFVNVAKIRPNAFQELHSPSRRPFYQQTALKNKILNNKVNIVKVNSVNTAKGKRVTSVVREQGINAVKSKACWVWRPKIKTKSVKHIGKSKEVGTVRYLSLVVPLKKVGDEAVHKELGDRMERAATTTSSFEAEQDSDAQTRFEAASKSPLIHLSQEINSNLQQRGERQRWSFHMKKKIWSQRILPNRGGCQKLDVETENAEEESSEVYLDVISATKILADAS
ncbi:putative ribonuclease H-like domain-containing protein [Tanacetum coccineum]